MRYFALATDYDGTIAHDGIVNDKTVDALLKLQASGRSLILVTGRELDDLQSVFDHQLGITKRSGQAAAHHAAAERDWRERAGTRCN